MAIPTGCEVSPVVLQGAAVALQICGVEVPVDKIDMKRMAKKTEVTSTASYQGGVIWDEFAPGSSGGSVSWSGAWRVSQAIQPPNVVPGRIYPVKAFPRKPGTLSSTDAGIFYSMNVFIDDSSVSLDPKGGVIEWKCSGTCTGPITDPSV